MKRCISLLLIGCCVLIATPSWALMCYTANQYVGYSRVFHDDTGTAVDPTSPAAILRITEEGSGTETFSTPTAPAKLNTELGWYGGKYQVAASPTLGTYEVFVKGTVPTAKTTKMLAARFVVRSACPLAPTVAGRTLGVKIG